MRTLQPVLVIYILGCLTASAQPDPGVRVLGKMRRMFTEHDIGPNVDLSIITRDPHVFALGPLAGLQGEITVLDGKVFVSTASGPGVSVGIDPQAKAVFLVWASVPVWNSVELPAGVSDEKTLAALLEKRMAADSRSAFLVRGTAGAARYHVQNFRGKAEELTHEAHDQAKVLYDLKDTPVELVGFFSNREADSGAFVHRGDVVHIHLISTDRKHMGHLESLTLAPGAMLLLPQNR